jgi:hypothetical protein
MTERVLSSPALQVELPAVALAFAEMGATADPQQDAAPRKQFGTTCIVLRLVLIPRRQVMGRDELAEDNLNERAPSVRPNESDGLLLPGITGREDNLGADPVSESSLDVSQPIGAEPRSAVTGRHEPGMGANETVDGLSGNEEAVRRAAEDETEAGGFDDLPVFDRAESMPKII